MLFCRPPGAFRAVSPGFGLRQLEEDIVFWFFRPNFSADSAIRCPLRFEAASASLVFQTRSPGKEQPSATRGAGNGW